MENIKLKGADLISATKLLGRAQMLSDGLACDHSGTGFELRGIFDSDIEIELYTTKEKEGCEAGRF